jgi:enoyl-CoA hydratase/carnithine racemase
MNEPSSAYRTLLVDRRDRALVARLNRPARRNAVSLELMHELTAVVAQAASDADVVALIVTGTDTYFSAGADLNEVLELRSPTEIAAYFGEWHRLNAALEGLPKPTIAAVEGFCFTGGFELALACDIRVAGAGSSFAVTSSKIGTVAGAGATQRLPRLIGAAKALEIMFSGDPIEAEEALRVGMINRLVARGEALPTALSMVAVYAERAPLSLGLIKRAVYGGLHQDLRSALELETFLVTTIYQTGDRREGISAFLEKRKARFRGE